MKAQSPGNQMVSSIAGAKVPFRSPLRQLAEPAWDWRTAVLEAIEAGRFCPPSEAVRRFESAFARYCGVAECICTASGSSALLLLLISLGIGPGDEIITVSNTFVATVEAIHLAGATAVLVDIDPKSYTLDPSTISAAVTKRTRAILPVHIYGHPSNMRRINEIAKRHHLYVIEEACQAVGAATNDGACGSLGRAAVFSFGRSKPLAGFGEGGAITTNDSALATKLRVHNNHGWIDGRHSDIGFNFRMHPLEAAILSARLGTINLWLERRRKIASIYNSEFAPLGIVTNPKLEPSWTHGFYVYVIEVQDRQRFTNYLDAEGVGWAIHYEENIHMMNNGLRIRVPEPLVVTEALASRIVSLPLFPELTELEVKQVVRVICNYFRVMQ